MKSQLYAHRSWCGILGVVALCLLSRLPQLMSPYFHADYNGDECVLGLMAKHMAQGPEFPFYFWGQSYGFCWLEAGAVALAIKFFGMGLFSLKVPMLLLWTLGCVFFYSACARWTGRMYSFWITCLLIFSPAWMGWSMRARGGYISAFLLSSIVLFLIARYGPQLNKKVCWGIGLLSGFIFFSQPIFLLGVLPLLGGSQLKRKSVQNIFICMAGFIGVFILGKVMAHLQGNTDYWQPAWFRADDFSVFVSTFKDRVFHALNQDAGFGKDWAPVVISNVWCVVALVSLGMYIWGLITKQVSAFLAPFLISVVLILGCTFFINCEDQYRYLLSLSVFLILWFGIQSFEWMNKNIFFKAFLGVVIGALIVLGILAAWNYRNSYRLNPAVSNEVPEIQKISKVIEFLKASGVKYVFSLDDDLSWKLMFFSREEIASRWMTMRSRQPVYTQAVTQAFFSGQKVALVGNMLDEILAYVIVANEGKPEIVADPYFVYLFPSKELIMKKLRFQVVQ